MPPPVIAAAGPGLPAWLSLPAWPVGEAIGVHARRVAKAIARVTLLILAGIGIVSVLIELRFGVSWLRALAVPGVPRIGIVKRTHIGFSPRQEATLPTGNVHVFVRLLYAF